MSNPCGYNYVSASAAANPAIVRGIAVALGATFFADDAAGRAARDEHLAAGGWLAVTDIHRDGAGAALKVARLVATTSRGPVLLGFSLEVNAGHTGSWGAVRVVGFRFDIDAETGEMSGGVKLGDLTHQTVARDCQCPADLIGYAGRVTFPYGFDAAPVWTDPDGTERDYSAADAAAAADRFVLAILAADDAGDVGSFMLQTAVHNPARGAGITYREDLADMADQCASTGRWNLAGAIRATR